MVKRKKRRYPNGDYGHKVFPRPLVLQVAMAVEPPTGSLLEEVNPLRFAFHGASKVMLSHVFRELKDKLFRDFSLQEDIANQMLNGKCYSTLVVTIDTPDLHRLSVGEWPAVIAHLMERSFRCRVTYFEKYEKFLNA